MDFLVVPITPGLPLGQWPAAWTASPTCRRAAPSHSGGKPGMARVWLLYSLAARCPGVRPCPLRRLQPARSTFTAYNTMRSVGAGPGGRMAAVGSGVPTQRFRRIFRAAGRRLRTGNEALLQAAG